MEPPKINRNRSERNHYFRRRTIKIFRYVVVKFKIHDNISIAVFLVMRLFGVVT
ncbi:hypothetical protein EVA_02944 [gut metagenome]|uniref:Uncharacterized protein n=1 Tax=gut metagenome TaxID=749906 RepID=J9H019_9ZZZZ